MQNKKFKSVRALAAMVINDVLTKKKSLENASEAVQALIPMQDRALLQELCYGCLRWYHQNKYLLNKLLEKQLKPKDNIILAQLLLGIYQLRFTRIPQYAAIAATVEAARELNVAWATGLSNAVLRNFLRQQESLIASLTENDEASYSHPAWLIEKLQQAWPERWREILFANNQHPPLHLRVNLRATTRDNYLKLLAENNIEASAITQTRAGIFLPKPCPVETLPNFQQGWISVQDAASQLATELLDLQSGLRVLDACAAPGGKLTHILEMENNLTELVAVEIDKKRLEKINENLLRLKLSSPKINLICADVAKPQTWWKQENKKFDRILIDAPCSATGVIRRHPDIKILRTTEDIKNIQHQQLNILNALWPYLAIGGILLYSTCSILPEENWLAIESFLTEHQDAHEVIIDAKWGMTVKFGRQILPGMENENMDGFYYAKIQKNND